MSVSYSVLIIYSINYIWEQDYDQPEEKIGSLVSAVVIAASIDGISKARVTLS